MRSPMYCLALAATSLVTTSALAGTPKPKPAPPPIAVMPKVGDTLTQDGAADWPKLTWLYDAPSAKDAAGKVVLFWFCQAAPKPARGSKLPVVDPCADDLPRVIALRDTGRVYIVALINAATPTEAKKLDPIRESEGVGKGTVAFGKPVTTLDKQLAIAGPASFVVDTDGKVQLISTGFDAAALDARDTKVNDLVKAIKDYTSAKDGPTTVKLGDKFALSLKITLANWLTFSSGQARQFDLVVSKDIKCDAVTLTGDQLKVDGHTLTAQVSCTGPKGVYQARGALRFGYDSPTGPGFGNVEGEVWKFEIK